MIQNSVAPLTTKGERTREHLYTTALELFIDKGYEQTTMRDIAAAAECSLGLVYRYFARKDDLILELYERLAIEMEHQVQALPRATVAQRFESIMLAKLAQIAPYRSLLSVLIGSALNPQTDVAVLGARTATIRERSAAVFIAVVQGASDAPRGQAAEDLGALLFAGHLGMILFWLYDRSPQQKATQELLTFARDMLALTRRLLRLPFVSTALHRLVKIILPVFGSAT